MSWWDYGYQIAGMANRTTLVDNNTWNNSHIAMVSQIGSYLLVVHIFRFHMTKFKKTPLWNAVFTKCSVSCPVLRERTFGGQFHLACHNIIKLYLNASMNSSNPLRTIEFYVIGFDIICK